VIDIRQTRFLDIQTEMADPMNCNQINLHFLSYFKYRLFFFDFKFFVYLFQNYFKIEWFEVACHRNQLIRKVFFLLLNFIVFLKQQQAGLKEFIDLFKYS